jgi:uncharacterized heparinase superfamily protein
MNPRLLKAMRYADAARHMQLRQLAHRPRRMLPAALLAAGSPGASGWRPLAAGAGVDPAPQSGPQPDPAVDGTFRFVGAERRFAPGFWEAGDGGRLFDFHLHAFAELAAYAAGPRADAADAFWARVIGDWLRECGRPAGDAWHPFPTSGRVIAWCAALSRGGWPGDLEAAMRASLARQLLLLRRAVEHDIGGNHVLRNGAALAIGGACLQDAAALRRGKAVLARELPRQILADGGHEERSPSYHRAVLADLRDVAAVLERSGEDAAAIAATADRMATWLAALAGPDGRLPLLNDAWEGPPVDGRPSDPLTDLAATGYVVLRHGGDQAVLDLAPVAPAHLPPHAHADVGSFTLWIDGRPVVVDPGAYAYEEPERGRFRATAAHATLEVDGRDQFDAWGPFRAGWMPNVERPRKIKGQSLYVPAQLLVVEHDGYRRLPDPVRHRREFEWIPGEGLTVRDTIAAARPHDTVSRLPLAPGLRAADLPVEVVPLGEGGEVTVQEGRYAPAFGQAVRIEVLTRRARLAPGAVTGWALVRSSGRTTPTG